MNRPIRGMFDRLPRVYEFINHIVSFGLDIYWRKRAASLATAKSDAMAAVAAAKGGAAWLDVSTGTGEMAAYLRRLSGAGTTAAATPGHRTRAQSIAAINKVDSASQPMRVLRA